MAINRQAIVNGLQGLYGSTSDASEAWATALVTSFASIAPPSTAVVSAKAALRAAIKTAFDSPSAAAGLDTALSAFATAIAGGMTSAVVPPTPVGFAAVFAKSPKTRAESAANVADALILWAGTGTAPGPVNWS